MASEHFDVLVVGAGLSGIAAAYYLQTRTPNKSYAILEGRDAIGGTWDLFRYPGVRSDSDMFTLGYTFYPWLDSKALADGAAILNYIRETASVFGIDKHIRFNHRVCRIAWSSADARWTVEVQRAGQPDRIWLTCSFLYMCTGYYDYDKGYTPDWEGVDRFKGRIIHPQHWDETLDYAGKRVIVIGSGATAVTLVPAMAEQAAHVTMLQRSPTYIVSRPAQDGLAAWLIHRVPARLAYMLTRWRAILRNMYTYYLARWSPRLMKDLILKLTRDQLGPDYDIDKHFSPAYNVWDQRVCLVPDADLFNGIKSGKVAMVTDHIETFTETGIRLKSGEMLEADIIVTATGLVMSLMNGVQLLVDGEPVALSHTMNYKGMMLSDVPNFAFAIGYTNASWTLKCELTSQYVCRLMNYMDAQGFSFCFPHRSDPTITEEPVISFTSGYVQRALASLPHQGSKRPWKLYQNYILDLLTLRFGAVDDGTLQFMRREQPAFQQVPGTGD